jgi:hypothetical protein
LKPPGLGTYARGKTNRTEIRLADRQPESQHEQGRNPDDTREDSQEAWQEVHLSLVTSSAKG